MDCIDIPLFNLIPRFDSFFCVRSLQYPVQVHTDEGALLVMGMRKEIKNRGKAGMTENSLQY